MAVESPSLGAGTEGEFYCARCGGDRSYALRRGRSWRRVAKVFPVPSRHRGTLVVCLDCRARGGPELLNPPTSREFGELLRDAGRALALAVLSAGGSADPAVREAACAAVRDSGTPDCTVERLLEALEAAERGRQPDGPPRVDGCGAWVGAELQAALAAVGPHLEEQGRAHLLTAAARVALADGPYRAAERGMLRGAGRALRMPDGVIEGVLGAAARAGR